MPLAHIGGVPVEESLPALAAAWAAVVYAAARFATWLRRR